MSYVKSVPRKKTGVGAENNVVKRTVPLWAAMAALLAVAFVRGRRG
jgi:hypothetical protein